MYTACPVAILLLNAPRSSLRANPDLKRAHHVEEKLIILEATLLRPIESGAVEIPSDVVYAQ